MADYEALKALHESLPPFKPIVNVSLLPYIAFILLASTFTLGFYFTTLPKTTVPTREIPVALLASVLGGFGVVALFCSVGVYV
ncbi:hypothetical protein PQX77_005578 [Marasmius sp. AFHP31]|uniref:Dolichyl-diphosphooligosaccharide-protein glycosyltransferase subunit OST5 n=1 Tax=Marasmius tenuissimus TaxID=585030 RepID=A0ABR2ZVG1_9AGAR|nr:hypothetical protein PM082_013961 [Marasmius tenuissimus]KAK1231298.1 hypothetical protein PQX77_005578 [Marasmius sp. AFHP31]